LENLKWRKSTYSGSSGGQCVEVAAAPNGIAIRDSKHSDGPKLHLDHNAFATLLTRVKE
jgi:hypothetical protein